MVPSQIIAKKRDGHRLNEHELAYFLDGFTRDQIPDYQMSALAMAILWRGMDSEETASLTHCMLNSGNRLQWEEGPPVVDKHSTGGIGDKVSIVLAPLLACCGMRVPMISGRGLGITGGTLDKLESIPGFRTDLSLDEITKQVDSIGCVITGATAEIAPADRKLYALRDVTATIESIPLITASIMSKKLAESLDSLVLDVKCGTGAFMRSIDQARELANQLVRVGKRMGVQTFAIISNMDQPLGRMVGNAVEIQEAIQTLKGNGPSDLTDLTLLLGEKLLLSTGLTKTLSEAVTLLKSRIANGEAFAKFEQMVEAQSGRLNAFELPYNIETIEILSPHDGFVASIDGCQIGTAMIEMGGGRKIVSDQINHQVGIEFLAKLSDPIRTGQPMAKVFSSQSTQVPIEWIRSAFTVSQALVASPPLTFEMNSS